VLLALTAGQPAWWVNAEMGDCGGTRMMAALLVDLVSVIFVVVGLFQARSHAAHPGISTPGA
jgi:hypothetical protein